MEESVIRQEFAFHKLNKDGQEKAVAISQKFTDLANWLTTVTPAGRERALVLTKLEEACFFAKKGMAVSETNQEVQNG